MSHAAAYLREVETATAASYLAALVSHMKDVPETADRKTRAVFTTLLENVRQAEARAKGATALLNLAAFFAPDAILEELFKKKAEAYPEALAAVVNDPPAYERATSALGRLSLMPFARETRTYSVHRLVQAVLRQDLGGNEQTWAAAAVAACNAAYPGGDFKHWPQIERLIPHMRQVAALAADDIGVPLALLLNRAGYFLNNRAAYTETEPLYKRDLSISEKALGPDHPSVGTSLNNLAGLYDSQGKYDLAEPLYKRSLAIREKALGPDHPDVGSSLNNLAGLMFNIGRVPDAVPSAERALGIFNRALGAEHPNTKIAAKTLAAIRAALET